MGIPVHKRSKLRFAVGDSVVCRLKNAKDGLERWVKGKVSVAWPELPGPHDWDLEIAKGEFAKEVPYKVDLSGSDSGIAGEWVYCHIDNHTLIRKAGLEPQTRVKGTSKRLEERTLPDGGKEKFDHQTSRGKRLLEDSGSDAESA